MDAHAIQNLSALVEVTKGADDSTGKLFDEADCDGEAAALLAGASEKIEFAVRCLSALAARVCIAFSGTQTANRNRGKTGCMARRLTARQPRDGSSRCLCETAVWRNDRAARRRDCRQKHAAAARQLTHCETAERPR